VLSDRGATLAEFEDYLRTVNNRDRRPYEEKTISAYVAPGRHLDTSRAGRSWARATTAWRQNSADAGATDIRAWRVLRRPV
jgi:hypothetical protein